MQIDLLSSPLVLRKLQSNTLDANDGNRAVLSPLHPNVSPKNHASTPSDQSGIKRRRTYSSSPSPSQEPKSPRFTTKIMIQKPN